MRLCLMLLALPTILLGQNDADYFTMAECLAIVKRNHPLVKVARLEITRSEADLLAARGMLDPTVNLEASRKEYENSTYYVLQEGGVKIPTLLGADITVGMERNYGAYLNPQQTVPENGLGALGIRIPLAKGLWTNERIGDIRKSEYAVTLSKADAALQANEIIFQASQAYVQWKKAHDEMLLYREYLSYAEVRYAGLQKLIEAGDKAGIDSVEVGIVLKNRKLNLEDAIIKVVKTRLDLSTFLWSEDGTPLELPAGLVPEDTLSMMDTGDTSMETGDFENHPKIRGFLAKIRQLEWDIKVKSNALLPKFDVKYSLLSEPARPIDFNPKDFMLGITFEYPLFTRKERGKLRASSWRLDQEKLSLDYAKLELKNKFLAQLAEVENLKKQQLIQREIVASQKLMLDSEERLFAFGESSVFLINTREAAVINAKLAQIALTIRYHLSAATLRRIMATQD